MAPTKKDGEPQDKPITKKAAPEDKPAAGGKKAAAPKASAESKTKSAPKAKAAEKKAAPKAKPKAKTAAKSPKKKASSGGKKRPPLAAKTYFAKSGEITPKWWVLDAKDQTLGRLSSQIATLLMGKRNPTYTPHSDTGDFVVVINAEHVKLTGKKWADKTYHYYTGYAGGNKSFTAGEAREKHPERLIEWAVWGMLPKGHLGRKWHGKLKVYAGAEHPHKAQKPQPLT